MKNAILLLTMVFFSLGLFAQNGSGTCDGSGPNGSSNHGSGQTGAGNGSGSGGANGNGAGDGSGPYYDVSLEEILMGEITTVVFGDCDGTGENGYQLIVDVSGEPVYVVLAPTPFLILQGLTFASGDFVTLTGVFMVRSDGTEVFVVRTMTLDNGDIVDFRDEFGAPLWKNLGRR